MLWESGTSSVDVCPYKGSAELNVIFSQHQQGSCVLSGQQALLSTWALQPSAGPALDQRLGTEAAAAGGAYAAVCCVPPSQQVTLKQLT